LTWHSRRRHGPKSASTKELQWCRPASRGGRDSSMVGGAKNHVVWGGGGVVSTSGASWILTWPSLLQVKSVFTSLFTTSHILWLQPRFWVPIWNKSWRGPGFLVTMVTGDKRSNTEWDSQTKFESQTQ
jgi:hypothetical protein